MRWDDLYLAGLGAYLPERVETAEQAIDAGRYTVGENLENGIRQVRTARVEDESPAEMAAAAARLAVARSGLAAEEFGLVVHGGSGHQGQEMWTPASYVQAHSVGGSAATAEVRQGSVSGLVALELAASWLSSRPDTAALVTAADSFHLPYVDRWTVDHQQVFGDGGGAAVLSSRGGFARVLATHTVSDSTLEPVYRGGGWTPGPFAAGEPVSLRARKHAYLSQHEGLLRATVARMTENLHEAVGRALKDADTDLDGIAYLIHANTGRPVAEWGFNQPLGVDPARTVWEWGRDYGHMGAADHFVNLDHLVGTAPLRPGDLVLTVGVGTGVVWTAVVLEMLHLPSWSDPSSPRPT